MDRSKRGRTTLPWLGLPLGGLLALAVALDTPWSAPAPEATSLEAMALDPRGSRRETGASVEPPREPIPARRAVVGRGETLGRVFAELGLSSPEAHAAAEASRRHLDPRQLRPGARWEAWLDGGGRLERFELELDGKGRVRLDRSEAGWTSSFRPFTRESRWRAIRGELDGSLEGSVARAGADGTLAYAMAEVLQWDLDFSRDLQPGDRFAVLFEEVWIEGERHGLGRIQALTYQQSSGRRHEAYRFEDSDGYYDADGRPLQKMFLRSPLPFSRVTSRFSNRRFHPVLKVFRPHYGVDYGAPVGTPVRATAAGTVVSVGWDGGGGNTVKVRHPNEYLTCYLHLSRFAPGVRPGTRVSQGDIVGYVGATGLATAPHLDYRVQHRGRWIDPMTLASVPAEPLSASRRSEFLLARASMVESLEGRRPWDPAGTEAATRVAEAGTVAAAAIAR
jgi:murein DD-endopeptidase MepM/ murein hydrolase activator NlpD